VPKRTRHRRMQPIAARDAEEAELLARVVDHYHAAMKESPEALGYLEQRGLGHPEVVEHFELGFANRTLGYRLPARSAKVGEELRTRLEQLGVYRTTGHEAMNGCLVVPLRDETGRVVQLYGRRIDAHLKTGTPKHLYLAGGHRGVFNREGLEHAEEAILCEAVLDALTFWCAGFRHVTTAYGVEGLTQEVIDALVAAKVRRVKIAFDRDEAGDRGAEKVAAKLEALGMETFRVVFPRGMDANAYAKKVAPAERSLDLVLRQAVWLGKGRPLVEVGDLEIAQPEGAADAEVSLGEATAPVEPSVEETSMAEAVASEPIPPAIEEKATAAAAPPAAPAPPAPEPPLLVASSAQRGDAPAIEQQGDDVYATFVATKRRWRVRPAHKGAAPGELRANVLVSHEVDGGGFFVDVVDLYSARQRGALTKQAAEDLRMPEEGIRRELGAIVLELERLRDAARAAEQKKPEAGAMTAAEREEALRLLRDPRLLDRVLEDLERAGVVGEETNKLVSYLAATSRKLEEPLAVVIQSSSAAGKSSLMEAVLALMPDEERVQYSAMTGQSLFYMSGEDLKHKILAIVEEEGAERASYALKLLQSEGELTIASTGKDPATGRHVTQTYRVEGPVMIFLTTTASDVDEELLNRCLVLTVDEGRDQTQAIHERQRRAQTLAGRLEREGRKQVRRLHKNAQRLLRPMIVVNPYAMELSFPDHATRTRRDHMKYLTLISAVTLLHQHQRPVRTATERGRRIEYIEATRQDVAVATRLAQGVLGRSLDELPPQTRRLLELLAAMVAERVQREGLSRAEVRFTRRQVREWTRWGQTQLKLHLDRLEEHEYLLAHRFGRSARLHQYELLLGDEGGLGAAARRVAGLNYDPTSSGGGGSSSGGHRGMIGPSSGHDRGAPDERHRSKKATDAISSLNGSKNTSPVSPTSPHATPSS
jgi:DNA primase